MDFSDRRDWRVVLIGTATYERLPDLPAVRNNLAALADILSDPELGAIPLSRVTVLADPEQPSTVYEAVRDAAADAEDTLIVYFSGHGLLDPDDLSALHLAMTAADGDNPYTALDAKGLLKAVRRSPARNRVVILDCCFSGRALEESMSAPEAVLDQLDPRGSCLITATTANEEALAPVGATYTAFTGILVDILRRGVPGGTPAVTLRDVHTWLQLRCEREGLPLPQWRGGNTVDRLPLVRNRGGVSARPVPVDDKALTVAGRHAVKMPRWATAVVSVLGPVCGGLALALHRHAGLVGGWWTVYGVGGVALILILGRGMVPRDYTLQVDRHGLAVKYPARRVRRYAWSDLTAVELTDRLSVRLGGPVPEPRPLYGWRLPRNEGERRVLAVADELELDSTELELALARRAPALVPVPSPAPESAEFALEKLRLAAVLLIGAVIAPPVTVIVAAMPGLARSWYNGAMFLGGLLMVVAMLLLLCWLVRPARVRLDAEGLTATLGGRRLTLAWNRVELLTITGPLPGSAGDAFLVVRVRKGVDLPKLRLPGPWRNRDGVIALLPFFLSAAPTWQVAVAGERFAGSRWVRDANPWNAADQRADATLIPLRMRGITFILSLLASLGICTVLDLLTPAGNPVPSILGPFFLIPVAIHAFYRLVFGDDGQLRVDQYGITGRLLGREFVRIPWTSVIDAHVQTKGGGLSLRLVVKDGHEKARLPFVRHTLDGIEIFPIPPTLGYMAAAPEDLERAVNRFWARPEEDRQADEEIAANDRP